MESSEVQATEKRRELVTREDDSHLQQHFERLLVEYQRVDKAIGSMRL